MINKRLGQSLPLNTIVIAILVIVVMLVIIVFFTSQVGDTGNTLNENNPTQCNINNPALVAIYGQEIEDFRTSTFAETDDQGTCPNGFNRMATLPNCCITDRASN